MVHSQDGQGRLNGEQSPKGVEKCSCLIGEEVSRQREERRECKRKAEKSLSWSSQARERGGIRDKVIVK